jgi:hypothetical protein
MLIKDDNSNLSLVSSRVLVMIKVYKKDTFIMCFLSFTIDK